MKSGFYYQMFLLENILHVNPKQTNQVKRESRRRDIKFADLCKLCPYLSHSVQHQYRK